MTTRVSELFERAAPRYASGNPLLVVERPATEALLPPLAGLRVLDVGSGPGHYARLSQTRGARLAVSLDLASAMVRAAAAPRLRADAEALPFAHAAFDVVVAALVLSHTAHPERLVGEMARVLRPGGVGVLSDLHPVAGELGWDRTFAGEGGATLRAPSPPLQASRLREILEEAGLVAEDWQEPAIGPSLEASFRLAGRTDFHRLRGTPLLVVARVRKGGC
jgi:ubiquinone/menaquinone biosynthesis C-methylase UbiE